MNVKELKEVLGTLPDDMEIIIQKDGEGNGYSPLEGADPDSIYVSKNTWSGEVYHASWTAEEAGKDESDWKKLQEKPKVLILFPVN